MPFESLRTCRSPASPLLPWLLACTMLVLATPASAAEAKDLASAVSELSDPDHAVREEARLRLLRLEVDDLPTLAGHVRRNPPPPAVRRVLCEVVEHVYRRGAKLRYLADVDAEPAHEEDVRAPFQDTPEGEPFLGIRIADAINSPTRAGPHVTVDTPLIGFNAYETLREGDVVLSAADDVSSEGRGQVILSQPHLTTTLRHRRPDDEIALSLLRGGAVTVIRFRLDRRVHTNGPRWQASDLRAAEDAGQFWRDNFVHR